MSKTTNHLLSELCRYGLDMDYQHARTHDERKIILSALKYRQESEARDASIMNEAAWKAVNREARS